MNPKIQHHWIDTNTVALQHGVNDEIVSKLHEIKPRKINFLNGSWKDLGFLKSLPNDLNHIQIGDDDFDWSILPQLPNLEKLTIGGWFKCDIDFQNLKSLRYLDTYWNEGYDERLFSIPQLRALKIQGLKQKDLNDISKLTSLEFLSLIYTTKLESLSGIEKLNKLRRLYLLNCSQLVNLSNIDQINIESLRIETCKKLSEIAVLSKLQSLKELNIFSCAEIDTLSHLDKLTSLKWLIFDNKLKNGDLSFIYRLENINRCEFKNKRNYSIKSEEIKDYLIGRGRFDLDRFSDWYAWGISDDFPELL